MYYTDVVCSADPKSKVDNYLVTRFRFIAKHTTASAGETTRQTEGQTTRYGDTDKDTETEIERGLLCLLGQ